MRRRCLRRSSERDSEMLRQHRKVQLGLGGGLTIQIEVDLALRLEEVALEDDYFVEKKLYPNVDFYSGIIYEALGIPKSMFTVIFAIARTVGWVAHWQEMIADPGGRIGRPRQLYTGPTERDYVAVDQRV